MSISKEQQDFLDSSGKIVLCACPGSGKTFVVAKKTLQYISDWSRPHQGVAVLSFTNVASEETQKQIVESSDKKISIGYPHFIGTIDSFLNNYIFLRFAYLFMDVPQRPIVTIDNFYTVPFSYWKTECHRNGCVSNINTFRWSIDGKTYKNNTLITCDSGYHGKPCDQYKKRLMGKGVFFQNDVSTLSYELLLKYPQIAKAVAQRFPIIFLDEAQDTSVEQIAVLDLLINAGIESFFLVGDPDQAIYEWRSATPECFINKINAPNWITKYLNENRRSSQKICNATQRFSKMLESKIPNLAVGVDKDFPQKPELILFKQGVSKEQVCDYFLNRCTELGIKQDNQTIAILTRGRIHGNTDIKNLWKSSEIELFARATYEWYQGSKKKAYTYCEKALYSMLIADISTISSDVEKQIETDLSYDDWKNRVLDVTCNLPKAEQQLQLWVDNLKTLLNSEPFQLQFRNDHAIDDVIKIKTRDSNVRDFKSIPLKNYFEIKKQSNITISSIHGIKGETYDATLLYISSVTGNTITPKLLATGDLGCEQMRTAYVAMTRPRKYLAIAMPKPAKLPVPRFPYDIWEYIEL